MLVRDIMATPAISVGGEATLEDAVGAMLENRVGSVLVIETGLWGILTRSDTLRALFAEGTALADIAVTDAMTTDVATIAPGATVSTAIRRMEDRNIKKLPVVEDIEVVGIVTATDIAAHQPERIQTVRSQLDRRDEWTD